ncbi:family 10 glycosylhydrolase [Massilia sp. IC2-477]|uniref:family 10 glycosylhydrolase n=1 Tax=Massilia sp. IC2-477 TaxID=2887198 RepID=UPI001D10F1F7|nr:family 10 glycosylhydrolase [Massilia sp. IC2-477]MCC2956333.1 family 10 glycosylhydrolase [Massilia sp. IC2-477]
MKKLLLAAAAAMLVASYSYADAQTVSQGVAPKRELRGVWISTHISLDWPSRTDTPAVQQSKLKAILDHNKATGMNAAFLQVRSQSDAIYPSSYEPWSYYLTGQQGAAPSTNWDPLQFAIDEARKRGMEFHAWINPYRAVATAANQNNTFMYAPEHVSRAHPEWMLTVGTVKILNPGLPAVRDHVVNVIMDIVNRYDVDGIHFDDYFYPSGTILDDEAYNADPRGFPNTTAGRADWRRDNINLLIARVNDSIRQVKPWVKFGVSPSGIYRSSTDPAVGSPTSSGASQHYSSMFADTRKWIQQGWVDYLAPQVYWYMGQTGSDYKLLVPWWNNNAFERHMYIGLADYKMRDTAGWSNPDEINNQIALNRSLANISGQIHFRHQFLQNDPLGYRTSLKNSTYARPALLPVMAWKGTQAPSAPAGLAASAGDNNAVNLSWAPAPDGADEFEKTRKYAIYRSEQREMDLDNPANLLGVTDTATSSFADTNAGAGQYYYYTVTALNRLSVESARANTVSNDFEAPTVRTREVSVTLANGAASITPADLDGGTSDNWGVESLSASRTSFACSDIGAQKVVLSAVDKGGNSASAEGIVTVLGHVPQPSISVSTGAGDPTGLPANTIALGYGAQSVQLTASDAAGSSSFTWSPAGGLSTSSGPVTTFAPTAAGSFSFTAQAASPESCFAQASATVNVIDARCGNDKVLVCHKTGSKSNPSTQVCVSPNAVPAHLKKGSVLGACSG